MQSITAEVVARPRRGADSLAANAAIYLPDGKPPVPGERFFQTDLANSIQYMADEERAPPKGGRAAGLEAARAAFYRGDIARRSSPITRRTAAGWPRDDLAGYRSDVETPLSVRFGDLKSTAAGRGARGRCCCRR